MTTRPSSSHPHHRRLTLLDSDQPTRSAWVPRSAEAAKAASTKSTGEPSLVAKVYHKTPLTNDQVAKLEAMVSRWSRVAGNDLRLAALDAVRSVAPQAVRHPDDQDGRRPAAARAVRHDESPPAFSRGRLAPPGAGRPQHGRRVPHAALGEHRRGRRQSGQPAGRQARCACG